MFIFHIWGKYIEKAQLLKHIYSIHN